MAKIIGIRPSSFTGRDGSQVSGKNIYLTEPLEKGEGLAADRVFITDAKLSQWTYQPKVGMAAVPAWRKPGNNSIRSLLVNVGMMCSSSGVQGSP